MVKNGSKILDRFSGRDAFAGILNAEFHVAFVGEHAGADRKFAAAQRLHGLSAVQDKIQNDLLNLGGIALHQRQIVLQIQSNFRADQLEFVVGQTKGGAHQLVQIGGRALRLGTPRKCQQIRDDASHAGGF